MNREWINSTGSFIGTLNGSDETIQRFLSIPKFNTFQVIKDNEASEPYSRENSEDILFGFAKIERAEIDQSYDNSSLLELQCP